MKLSDFLFNIGKPVAFYPGLVKALGSMKQAVFICQMAYWKDKGNDPDGWIYKTAEEIETETSLTYKEQTTVRAALVEKKALQERYARTEHQMYFRVDWDAVNTIWDEHLTNGHMPNGKVAPSQKSDGILPKVSSLNSNSENTQKNTSLVDENLAFLTSLYEKNIGMVFNSNLADELQEYAAFPREWIERAFKEMADANVRTWRYVRKCLDSWKQAGKITEKPGGSKPTTDARPAINEAVVEATKQKAEDKWNFTPAPPPASLTKPVLKQPERRLRR
jgi:DnaD/phage-associated family protein